MDRTRPAWQYAADLAELRYAGQVDVPWIAYIYATLNREVDTSTTCEPDAFCQPGVPGSSDIVHLHWTHLRDQLQNILGKTSTTLQQVGQTLVHVEQGYAAADHEAAQLVDNSFPEHGRPKNLDPDLEQVPPASPPPVRIK